MTELMNRLEGFRSIEIGSFEVTGIHVMKSVLKPAGAEYVSLARIPIGTGRNNVE
jgi:2'-5' RNA ligase